MVAREKYSARPALSSTTLTTFGLKASAASCSGWAQVAIGTCTPICAAQAASSDGSISGSSPCRLTTTASSARSSVRATSAMRSVPEGWSLRVKHTSTPCAAQAARMSSWSVATMMREAPDRAACSATRTTIGLPPRSASGLLGRRVDARRAGMMTINDIAYSTASCRVRASSAHMMGMPSRIGYARRSARQINSCAFLSCSSWPLQTGHTKISSSRASTTFLHNLLCQRVINMRTDRDDPQSRVVFEIFNLRTFYCILLRDQYQLGIECGKWLVEEIVMVGQRQFGKAQTGLAQHGKKTLRIADAGRRHDALASVCQLGQRFALSTVCQAFGHAAGQLHGHHQPALGRHRGRQSRFQMRRIDHRHVAAAA